MKSTNNKNNNDNNNNQNEIGIFVTINLWKIKLGFMAYHSVALQLPLAVETKYLTPLIRMSPSQTFLSKFQLNSVEMSLSF